MRFQNKAKPIKFCLSVGDKECRSVEDVKKNFAFDSLYDSFKNGTLQKWLKQIGAAEELQKTGKISGKDEKIQLYNLFSKNPLQKNVDENNVVSLLEKGRIKFDVIKNTPLVDNVLVKMYAIDHNCVDEKTINNWCEKDYEFLEYIYSNKSYCILNPTNCKNLIDLGFEKNVDKIMTIATDKNLNDILERYGKLSVKLDNVSIEMILVKGYSGGNFYIGKYPVTQKQWRAVMGDNPSYFKGEDNPVEQVSWYDCNLFISKLNKMYGRKFRLPKEKEWEFAARGGNKRSNKTYSGSNNLDEVGWYRSDLGLNKFKPYSLLLIHKTNSGEGTHPVGKKKPNELDIYDMSGNVWEWCEDLYQSSGSNRVFRGGSWTNDKSSCKVDSRSCNTPDHKINNLGFRLAMDM
jgi:hypothetical protein